MLKKICLFLFVFVIILFINNDTHATYGIFKKLDYERNYIMGSDAVACHITPSGVNPNNVNQAMVIRFWAPTVIRGHIGGDHPLHSISYQWSKDVDDKGTGGWNELKSWKTVGDNAYIYASLSENLVDSLSGTWYLHLKSTFLYTSSAGLVQVVDEPKDYSYNVYRFNFGSGGGGSPPGDTTPDPPPPPWEQRTAWSKNQSRPSSGWTAWNTSESRSMSRNASTAHEGTWYLHAVTRHGSGSISASPSSRGWDNTGVNVSVNYNKSTSGSETYEVFGPYRIDVTKPTISYSPNGGNWRNTSHTPSVSISDSLSGVNRWRIRYSNDNGSSWSSWSSWNYSSTSTSKAFSSEGKNRIRVQAFDNAGNSRTRTSNPYLIDKTPPNIELDPKERLAEHETYDLSTDVDVTITMSNPAVPGDTGNYGGSGLRDYRITWSETKVANNDSSIANMISGSYTNLYGTSYSKQTATRSSGGPWYLYVQLRDRADNVSYKMGGPYYIFEHEDIPLDPNRRIRLIE